MDNCTIGKRVLIHLSCYSKHSEDYVCPPEMTQDGMALKLGISRAHAALELKRLKERNQVEHRLAHVNGAKSRRKVYSLTMTGERLARDLKEAARMKRIKLLDGNGGAECTGYEAIRALCSKGLSESEATVKVLTSEAIPVMGNGRNWHERKAPEGLVGRVQEFARLNRWLHSPGKAVCVLSGAEGTGKTTLAKAALSGVEELSIWLRLRPLESMRSMLAEVGAKLAGAGKPRIGRMLELRELNEREAALALAEDLAGGFLVLDDAHNSPDVEGFVSLFLTMNAWPVKILVICRRKSSFCQRWSDTFQRPYEDLSMAGLDIESARKLLQPRSVGMTEVGLAAAHAATQGRPLDLLILSEFGWPFEGADVPSIMQTIIPRLSEEEKGALRLLSVVRGPVEPAMMRLTQSEMALFDHASLFQISDGKFLLHDSLRNQVAGGMGFQERMRMEMFAAAFEESRGNLIGAAAHLVATGNRERAVDILVSNAHSIPIKEMHPELLSLLRLIGEESRLDAVRGRALDIRGRSDEARLCYERALSKASGREATELLMLLGELEIKMAGLKEAEGRYAIAEEMSRGMNDELGRGMAKQGLARVNKLQGSFEESLKHVEDAKALLERAGHRKEAARCDAMLGLLYVDLGNPAGAVAWFTRAVETLGNDHPETAFILSNLARAQEEMGDYKTALSNYLKAEDVAKVFGQAEMIARSLAGAAECSLAMGRTDEASEHCRRALKIGESLGDDLLLSVIHATLGTLNRRLGMWKRAESHLVASIELIKRMNPPHGLATRYKDLADLYGEKGDSRKARIWSTRAERMMEWEGQDQRSTAAGYDGESR